MKRGAPPFLKNPTDEELVKRALDELIDMLNSMFRYDPRTSAFGMKFVERIQKEIDSTCRRQPADLVKVIERVLAVGRVHYRNVKEWFEEYGAIWPDSSKEAKADHAIEQFRKDRGYPPY